MTQFYSSGPAPHPSRVRSSGLLWAFCLALSVPYLPVFAVVGLQLSNWLTGCPPGFAGPCVLGPIDIADLGNSYGRPLMFAYRKVHLLHYLAYGTVLAVIGHYLFHATWSRLTATCVAAATITLPVAIIEVSTAAIRIAERCLHGDTGAEDACTDAIAAATGIYVPMALFTWAIVMILPVTVILTVAHALVCLGKDIVRHLRKPRAAS